MAKRNAKNAHLVEPTWGESEDGGPPLTELTSELPARYPVRGGPQLSAAGGPDPVRAPDRQAQPGRLKVGRAGDRESDA